MSLWQILRIAAGPVAAAAVLLFADLDPARPAVTSAAAVAVWMALWWLTEAVPLAATALLPLALFPLLGIASGGAIAGAYINSTIFLFLGGFLLALAMERWHLHRRIALKIILLAGGRPAHLVLGFMLSAAVLSMWISNTATAIMMLPMALAILSRENRNAPGADGASGAVARGLGPCLLLGIAYAASIGGMATPVGTPPNLIMLRTYNISFPDAPALSFGQWMFMGVPFALAMLFATWALLTQVLYRRDLRDTPAIDAGALREEYVALGPTSREERAILVVFVLTALLWCFRSDIELGAWTLPGWSGFFATGNLIDDGTVAILMALLLFVIPTSSKSRQSHPERPAAILDGEVFRHIPWAIVVLFGGGFALAEGFVASGLAEYLVSGFARLEHLPLLLIIAVIALGMTFLTELTSNTASTQMVLPVLAAAAAAQGLHPLFLMLPATLSASMAFMMPVATPPNAIVFSSDRLRIFDMARAGLFLNLIGVLFVSACVYWLASAVFQIDPGAPAPEWLHAPPAKVSGDGS